METYVVYQYDKSEVKQIEWTFSELEYGYKKWLRCKNVAFKAMLMFCLCSKGKQRVLYVTNKQGEVIHFSFIIPYCRKFSFMQKQDYCLGPCWTKEEYRGRGIYGVVLNYIAMELLRKNEKSELYVLIRESNISSLRGISKANFYAAGKIRKTKYLKHYKHVEWSV